MTEPTEIPEPEMHQRKSRLFGGISLVWTVPIAAMIGALGLAFNAYNERDVEVEIQFAEADGIEPGKTQIKFRNLVVGTVADMRFSDDLQNVIVEADIHRNMERYLDADTRFWLVTAKVTASGITGLNTLLSGAYINVDWDATQGEKARSFVALKQAPVIQPGAKGTEVILSSPKTGSVSVGAPVLHKGVTMGTVEAVEYDEPSDSVRITVFINAPHDRLINTGTRFWNASGINVELNDKGLQLNVGSLSSVLQGGVEFDTTRSGGQPIKQKAVFDLYATKALAEDSRLDDNLRSTVTLSSSFEGSLKGLSEGSEVLFRGLKVGLVTNLSAITEINDDGAPEIRILASYTVQPNRLGLNDIEDSEETLSLIAAMVDASGLRARLMPNSFLSGGLHIELFEDPSATPATLDIDATPNPILPSIPTPPDTLSVAAEGVLDRVAQLPIEELMDRIIHLVGDVNEILSDENTKAIPADVRTLLENVNTVASSEGIQSLPDELSGTVASVRDILQRFDEAQGVDNMVGALKDLRAAVANISTASETLPELLADIDQFVDKANGLPLNDLVTSADDVLKSADHFISNEDMDKIPGALSGALDQAKLTLEDLRGTVTRVDNILTDIDNSNAVANVVSALEDVKTAAANVSTASDGLPKLVDDIDGLVNKANDLPLDSLVTSADQVLQSADDLLNNEDMDKVPGALAGALDAAQATLNELREGGAAENLNRTLQSASTAADNISAAVKDLPKLADQLEQLADTAEATIGAYGPNSPVNREVQAAIADLRKTVNSLNSLVQAIRRKPNSLLVGR